MSNQPASTPNNNWVLVIAACAAGWFLSSYLNKPKTDVVKPDVVPVVSVSKSLDAAYKADRASKLAILRELSNMDADKDELRLKRLNELSDERRRIDFKGYADLVAEALFENKLTELADSLEKGK
jgi:hypothetical protein